MRCRLNSSNKIVSYSLVNEASPELVKSFSILNNYRFPASLVINKHYVVFLLTVENKREDYKTDRNKFYTPSEIAARIYSQLAEQLIKDPQTVVIDRVIIKGVYDTLK